MMSDQKINFIKITYEEAIIEEVVELIDRYVENKHDAQVIILLISTVDEYPRFKQKVISYSRVIVWHIEHGRYLYDRDTTLISLSLGMYQLVNAEIYDIDYEKIYTLADYLLTVKESALSLGILNQEFLTANRSRFLTKVEVYLHTLMKCTDFIEDVEIVHHLNLNCNRYLEVIAAESMFYLKDSSLCFQDYFQIKSVDLYLNYPYTDIKAKYDNLLNNYKFLDCVAVKLRRRSSFFSIISQFQYQFKSDVKVKQFPKLLLVLSVYLFIISVGYKNNNEFNLGCLTLFRSLEIFCIGILISNSKGMFNNSWEFTLNGVSGPTFGNMWTECKKCTDKLKYEILDSIRRIQHLRNNMLFAHGFFSYNEGIFNYFYSNIKRFILEYEKIYIPLKQLRQWEDLYSENNVSIMNDIHKNLIHSTLNDLNYEVAG